ncbi:MAG TPA: NAD(P)H-dependent oxidoreductase [Rhizomicrobium sp.]|jgi:multimeric flavodoxin WrbA
MALKALAFNCTLKSGDEESSTDNLLSQVLEELEKHDVGGEIVRVADHNIKPGVRSDEGKGDAWPKLRRKLMAAQIFVLGTPIWLGQPSSLAKRVMERMDAFLDEKDKQDRMPSYGKIALCAIVGNEDGAHHCSAEIFQALNDVGFTVPANGMTYWVGEAMGDTNFKDLKKTPKVVADATAMMVRNAVHLAQLLAGTPFPGKT